MTETGLLDRLSNATKNRRWKIKTKDNGDRELAFSDDLVQADASIDSSARRIVLSKDIWSEQSEFDFEIGIAERDILVQLLDHSGERKSSVLPSDAKYVVRHLVDEIGYWPYQLLTDETGRTNPLIEVGNGMRLVFRILKVVSRVVSNNLDVIYVRDIETFLAKAHRAMFHIAWQLCIDGANSSSSKSTTKDLADELRELRECRVMWANDLRRYEEFAAETWCDVDQEVKWIAESSKQLRASASSQFLDHDVQTLVLSRYHLVWALRETASHPPDSIVRGSSSDTWTKGFAAYLVKHWNGIAKSAVGILAASLLAVVCLAILAILKALTNFEMIANVEWFVLAAIAGLVVAGVIAVVSLLDFRLVEIMCLRLPSAAIIGVIALFSIDSAWIDVEPSWWLMVGLVAAFTAYVATDAIRSGRKPNFGSFRGSVMGIAFLAELYALAVSAVALKWIAPAFLKAPDGMACQKAMAHWQCLGHPLQTWFLLANAALCVGLFLQTLWDDRPLTAPLSRPEWRRK